MGGRSLSDLQSRSWGMRLIFESHTSPICREAKVFRVSPKLGDSSHEEMNFPQTVESWAGPSISRRISNQIDIDVSMNHGNAQSVRQSGFHKDSRLNLIESLSNYRLLLHLFVGLAWLNPSHSPKVQREDRGTLYKVSHRRNIVRCSRKQLHL